MQVIFHYLNIGRHCSETPALERSAIEYVIDADSEYRGLEAQLRDAEEQNNGHQVALP